MITEAAIQTFVEAVTTKVHAHFDTHYTRLAKPVFSAMRGPRFTRIVREDPGSRSVYCFVDNETGAILKAAGWKAPAKHARGNIANGANDVGPYGPAYLR